MKTLLRLLKNFWFLLLLLWLASLLTCWLVAPLLPWLHQHVPEALAIISACFLLVIVLRQYQRIRAEHNLENLLQIEVDRSWNATGEFRDQQVLRERLKHAIAMLRTDRSAGGGGKAALSDLPWYLVVGMSAAGKTSLLTHSGLSASIATANDSESGTQHCDWYFSPDAVMIDTAGRYLRDDQSASEFSAFLRMLRKQRGKAAINGLVMVVSLPELLAANGDERNALAAQLVARVEEYAECLDANPPVYLMLSKTDQLPGFSQAFDGLDLHERQQPLGMTFGLSEVRNNGLHAVLQTRLGNLQSHIRQHVDAQVIALGAEADSTLLNFPQYFAALSGVLEQFLEHFTRGHRGGAPLLLRGLYFTSALQTGQQLGQVYEDVIADEFALQAAYDEHAENVGKAVGNRSFFITDTFRQVIFPDRDLTLYQSRLGRQATFSPLLLGLAAATGLLFIGWQALSFANNRQWLDSLRGQLAQIEQAEDREQQLAAGKGLEVLREQMANVEAHRLQGVPLQLGGGLYHGEAIHQVTRNAYLAQLRSQALEPIARSLQVQMRAFNTFASGINQELEFTPAPLPKKRNGKPLAPAVAAKAQAALGNTRAGAYAAKVNLATASDAAELSATTGGLSLSEEMLGRLDEQQVASIIDAYNTLKLYLLLTEPQGHPDPAFVAASLPQAWASAAAEGTPADAAVIAENAPLYVQLLEQGQAPSLPRNEQLINETRQNLKSFMISSSLVDREYLRLQLESSRQFPALSLNDLVPLPGRALLYSSAGVPAIYTRQGWDTFVKPELIKLVSGNLRNESDWVLDGEGGDAIVQKANFVREFMTRYKRDYTQAWYKMVSSVGVRHFADLASATQQLGLLSDVQNSPVKNLLAAVNDNTQWDLPVKHAIPAPGSTRDDGFWSKVSGLLDTKDALPANVAPALPAVDDGSLAKRFEPVARVFAENNAEGADSTIMDRYLAALRKLKVRMNNIQRSQDVGKSSKQLISETLEGQPSEVTTVRNYVESSVDTSQDSLSRALQGLFSLPIQYAWATLRDPAGQQIAKAWAQQIAKPWEQVMAHRYPIAGSSRNEASVKDLQRFVDPDSGLLPAFKRNEIGNLAGGEGLGVGDGKGPALVNPGMLNSIDKASSVGQVIASLSDRDNGFEIMLEPSANFTDIVFTLDGQEQHYRNGRSSWNRFAWPGTSNAPGARLDVVTLSGARVTVFDFPGRWGLLRMNESARVDDLDGIQQRFSWNTANGRVSLVVRNFGGVKLTDLGDVKALSALNDRGAQ
ncbi:MULTISPECIES: type VI secretion protein IcmF/TssM N-terminal domain-containing protein [unclassified Pseudomonas]|uniref:type VI secretion protein IcmF/TssM N-terminal domain-containing protein n=1 Tax=unclassified Pseudomonas TaxID=196821 RepID=UPI001A9E5C59|nr:MULTISPECIES: type VI secretion protein IcmF/TssM N-terminal domain-containing protein [unclassified Pseudomonas]MCE5988343.1 ImcF-like family protein [Pseudomonas sp. LM20]MCE5994966.1 ImcF-like family protein [Pseudomonas sp. KCA11]